MQLYDNSCRSNLNIALYLRRHTHFESKWQHTHTCNYTFTFELRIIIQLSWQDRTTLAIFWRFSVSIAVIEHFSHDKKVIITYTHCTKYYPLPPNPWNRSEFNCIYFAIHVWKKITKNIKPEAKKTIFSLIYFKLGGHVISWKVTHIWFPH